MKTTIIVFFVFLISSFGINCISQTPTRGLVAYYPFNGNANDESNYGNNGTVFGASLITDRCGAIDSAYSFDGLDDYILSPDNSQLNFSNEITLCAWIKPKYFRGHGNSAIISKGYYSHTDPFYQYHLGITGNEYPNTPGKFSFSLSLNYQYVVITADSVWNEDEWYFVAATYNGNYMRIFINGKLVIEEYHTGQIDIYNEPLCIGRTYRYPGNQYTPGVIDDIRIYNTALSTEEINQLYITKCNNIILDGLISYFPFNGNATDATGNGNTGSVHGPDLTTDRCGNPNSAYMFDGIDDFISLNPTYILPESKGTFAAWVYFNSLASIQYLGCMGDTESQDYYLSFIRFDPNYQRLSIFRRTPGNADILIGSTPIVNHQWYFVVMTSDGNEWTLYVNGEKEDISIQSGTNTGDWGNDLPQADNWILGGISILEPYTHAFLNGKLDDIRIYDYPLNHEEILVLFNSHCPMEVTGDQLLCQGQKDVLYSVQLIDDLTYKWSFSGEGAVLNANRNQLSMDFSENASSGTLSMTAERGGQTINSSSIPINFLELPDEAGNITGPTDACINDGPYTFSVPPIANADQYNWNFTGNDAEILKESNTMTIFFYTNATSGSITVSGINQCGEGKISQSHPVIVNECETPSVFINIPNSFSPNGDNINDFFIIRGLKEGTAIKIFDRNGKILYQTDNYNNDWNGIDMDGNIIQTGTYWYVIKVPGLNNDFKGFLYIKK